jgi:hypothetical protein
VPCIIASSTEFSIPEGLCRRNGRDCWCNTSYKTHSGSDTINDKAVEIGALAHFECRGDNVIFISKTALSNIGGG